MKAMIWIAAALAVAPLTAAAAQPQSIEARGTVPHAAAGSAFPERVGDFRRVDVTRFDDAGRDISGSYTADLPNGRVLVSVYLYPAPPVAAADRVATCRQQFAEVRQIIEQQYKDVSVTDEAAPPALDGADPTLSHRAVFRLQMAISGRGETVRSEARLYCYVGGDWLVKYRATSTGSSDPSDALEAFIRAGPWPGRAPAG